MVFNYNRTSIIRNPYIQLFFHIAEQSMADTTRTIYLLKKQEVLARTKLEQALRGLKITTAQYAVLTIVDEQENLSSDELARHMSVKPPSINELILALERHELVQRQPAQDNKKILRISLTAEGKSVLQKCHRKTDKVEQELYGCLSDTELSQLRQLVQKIILN